MKKKLARIAALVLCCGVLTSVAAFADYDDYRKPTWISADGRKAVTMRADNYRELEVNHNGNENDLKWSVTKGKKVVKIVSRDRTDDEVRIKALKTGTAKVTCRIQGTSKKVTYTVTVKKASAASKKIHRVGAKNVTISLGEDRDLEVRKGKSVRDRDLHWSITGAKGIVVFDDDDLRDDEVEIRGTKVGSTEVTCTNRVIGQKITFAVTVVDAPYYDYDD